MSTFEDEHTADGHTILLIETERDSRTFSDYPNKHTCLETIVNMYEEENSINERHEPQGLADFMKWIDSFYQIKLLVFDKEISRYRMTEREGLKKLFEENPDNGSYGPIDDCNGDDENSAPTAIVINGLTGKVGRDDDDSDDGESHWDE